MISVGRPTLKELTRNSLLRHGKSRTVGPVIRCRRSVGYFTAEEFYELTVDRLVDGTTRWLDVGCGRDLLPMNPTLALKLSRRCERLVGVDPDQNILQNSLVHEIVQRPIERYVSDEPFNLITMRMVVEHIKDPRACIESLRSNTRSGSVIVIYTPHKYSVTSIASAITPSRCHHAVKNKLWHTEERDTFPTFYRMNTVRSLRNTFVRGGFVMQSARKFADAALFHSYPRLAKLELYAWFTLRRLRLGYPECNILAVFQRV